MIDGSGRTLMPGLTDMHWHAMFVRSTPAAVISDDPVYTNFNAAAEATATLMRGFTTVHDLGGPVFALKRAIDEGIVPAAHLSVGGDDLHHRRPRRLPPVLRDRPVSECLMVVLEEAAGRYVADPGAAGCLVLDGTHCNDPDARTAAQTVQAAAEDMVRRYISVRHPEEAERLTVSSVGLSAKSRNGHGLDRLLATARLAGLALAQALPPERRAS